MGFFSSKEEKPSRQNKHLPDTEFLHKNGCKVCPLNNAKIRSPKMLPTGTDRPIVYIIGEAPGADEDDSNEQFVGRSGRILRAQIPRDWKPYVRWSNTIHCRPPDNSTPEPVEVECCRPRNVADIEKTRPRAIFGFGAVPLNWALGASGATTWRGRRAPVKIGTYTTWYYAMLHPSYILRQPGSEEERMFRLDIARAFAEVESLPEPSVHTPEMARANVTLITGRREGDLQRVRDAVGWAKAQPAIGLDYETSKLRPYQVKAKICTAAFGTDKQVYAVAFDHREAGWSKSDRVELDNLWRELLASPVKKVVHNLAFEMEWTGVIYGRQILRAGPWDDTMSQAAILDERKGGGKPGAFALDFLTMQYFGLSIKKLSSVDTRDIDGEPLEDVLLYNGIDSKYHYLLGEAQTKRLETEGLMGIYKEHLRRIPTVVLTQIKGLPVSVKVNQELDKKYSERIEKIVKEIQELEEAKEFKRKTGQDFNPGSSDDVAYVCKNVFKHPGGVTKKGNYSVEKEILEEINQPLTLDVIKYRQATHQHSTYILPLKVGSPILWPDGMLHPILNTVFARTGRLSSEDPNEQNFPKRDGEAKEVRRQVEAPAGHSIVAIDFSQIEARVIAMYSRDKVFCKALWEGYDVHMEWAERLSRAYPKRVGGAKNFTNKKVMKDFRTDIKNQWTFPLFFGAQLSSASHYLDIPEKVLEPLYNEFWKTFNGVKGWQEELLRFYHKNGFVQYLTGRRRRGPMSDNEAINAPIQGTTADIVLHTMSRISEEGGERDWHLQPILNVHDDLTFIFPNEGIDNYCAFALERMLFLPYEWVNVPIAAELSIGPNWCDLEEAGTYASNTWK